ncbi:MAG: RidA family protein [Rhodospirillaceae bacterium]|nr:RidA family protein [Rhodospirillaceae bacterium]
MPRQLLTSGSKFEDLASFSRAVIDGDWIFISGTTGYNTQSGAIAADAKSQTEEIFRILEATLAEAKSSLADVLRVCVFIVDPDDLMPVCEVVGRKFKGIRPANTTVFARLARPEMKVEIEVTARRGSAG